MKNLVTAIFCLAISSSTVWAQVSVRRSSPKAPPQLPVAHERWDRRDAAHLLRRAGLGGSAAEINAIYDLGRSAAIDFLVDYESVDNQELNNRIAAYNNSNPGRGLDVSMLQYGEAVVINGQTVDTRGNQYLNQVERWWMFRLAYSRRPLEEKMTLFWHDHFATAASKVRDWQYILWQNETFRRHALGNFRTLVAEVAKDPAMLIWLDNRLNVVGNPNENFAHELMELFTTGIGHYTELDVKEAARAFTGWGLNGRERKFQFYDPRHDHGYKTFMGSLLGDLDGSQIIEHLTRHPATARHISKKLFEFFAYNNPPAALVDSLADIYLTNNCEIRPVVRAILKSPEFWSAQARRNQIKSPVEFVVGAIKELGASVNWLQNRNNPENPLYASQQMGMRLLEPPDVNGWDWGTSWFNTATTLARFNFANSLACYRNNQDSYRLKVDPDQLVNEKNLVTAPDVVDYFLDLMLQSEISSNTRYGLLEYLETDDLGRFVPFELNPATIDKKVRGLIYLIMIHPEYQMK